MILNWTKYCLALLAFCFSFTIVKGQKADAKIDRESILIGEQAVLSLSCIIEKENPASIVFPNFQDTIIQNLEIVSRSSIDTLITSEGTSETRLEQKLYLTSFDTGYYVIPPLEFKVDNVVEKTSPLLLNVETVEIDTTGSIRAAEPNLVVQVGIGDYIKVFWPYAAGVLGLAALAAIIFILIRKQKAKPKTEKVVAVVEKGDPYELALEVLHKIKDEALFKRGKVKAYHTEITDSLRDFIETVFGVHTHEQTSSQIMNSIKYTGLNEVQQRRLRKILFRADMVKFAKFYPEETENIEAVKEAIQFVKEVQISQSEESE